MVQIVLISKQVIHTLWKQRVCIICAVNGAIGIALMTIGTLAFIGCIGSLALSYTGAIGLLVLGGVLLTPAAPWLLIKVVYEIKNKLKPPSRITHSPPLSIRTPRGANPIKRFKELCGPKVAAAIQKFFNQKPLFDAMNDFEENHQDYDYFLAEFLENSESRLIVGVVQASGDGNISWHSFRQTNDNLIYEVLKKDKSSNQYQSSKAENAAWNEDIMEMFALVIQNIQSIQ